jgi:L-lysine exporter family protein LysE/ArgO
VDGFVLTFLNPYTIIFWASMSTQLSMFDLESSELAYIWLGTGLIVGAISWVLILNGSLHATRSKMTPKFQVRLNQMGAFILFSLAILGLYKGVNLIGWV